MDMPKKRPESQRAQRPLDTEFSSPFLEQVFTAAQMQEAEDPKSPSEMLLRQSPFLNLFGNGDLGLDETQTKEPEQHVPDENPELDQDVDGELEQIEEEALAPEEDRERDPEEDRELNLEEDAEFDPDEDEELDPEEILFDEENYLDLLDDEVDPALEEAEFYTGEGLSDLELGQPEIDDQAPYLEEQVTQKNALLPRMKFEIQTFNKIWRNDGRTAATLLRKYGPRDFLIRKKRVRLESETHGVLEFETKWLRKRSAVKKAINKAIEMTEEMNDADPAKFEPTRQVFPFNVDHLRVGSKKEKKRGYWYAKKGMEGRKEKILGAKEVLETAITDRLWKADFQSSECILLHQYEAYLKQHEWPDIIDSVIKQAKEILEAVRPAKTSANQLSNLHSFLQMLVYYIQQGQGESVKGDPSKYAFVLMSRTNFASIYRRLLRRDERRLFYKIVRQNDILNNMGLNRKSWFFIDGYGSFTDRRGVKKSYRGPTVFQWLVGIYRGRDLLSGPSVKGMSDAMGKYSVETRRGKKDRWLVKFETRATILTRTFAVKDWLSYVMRLYDFAHERRRWPVAWVLSPLGSKAKRFLDLIAAADETGAISLAHRQGIVDENKLAGLVFHAHHPELVGRRIKRGERGLARTWLLIRNDVVRPFLKLAG